MKCPYCEREMRKGYLHCSDQPVQWIPEGVKPSIWRTGLAEGAVELGDSSFWSGYRADSFYCAACKFVFVPVK